MKKKIALLLSMILTFSIMLGACGTDPKKEDYNGKSYDDLKAEMQTCLTSVIDFNQIILDQVTSYYGMTEEDLQSSLESSGTTVDAFLEEQITALMQQPEALTSSFGLSQACADKVVAMYGGESEDLGTCTNYKKDSETGKYVDPDELKFTVSKAGKTLTTTVELDFEKDGKTTGYTFELVYNTFNMEMTGINMNEIQSLSKKMSNAGLNTLISMLVVFIVLILISLIIYCFNIIPYLEKKKQEKNKKAEESQDPVVSQIEQREQMGEETATINQDTELIAVIAAAIAASTGTSTNDFVVRSINRR